MAKIITYEQVKTAFQNKNYQLLEVEYINAHAKMKYICKCGMEHSITWNNFNKIKGCWNCYGKQRITIGYLKQYFKDRNCELIDSVYNGDKVHMNYVCSCGNESKTYWENFRKGHRCRKCMIDKIKGENSPHWNINREIVKLNEALRKRYYNAIRNTLNCTGKRKCKKSFELLGFNVQQLREHIQKHPQWEALKDNKWTIDHIFPIKAFIDYKIYDPAIINCLENLQPMEARTNYGKGAKYDKNAFEKWLDQKGLLRKSIS
jgi:hypothetical protein